MHEHGMCAGIVDAVQRRAAGRRVARIKIRVGVMRRISLDAFKDAFAHVAAGSAAKNAVLDIVAVPVQVVCRSCEARYEADDVATACVSCNGVNLQLSGGDELVLESVYYDVTTDGEGETAGAPERPAKR